MSTLLTLARLALAAVFAVAGWAKLSDQTGTREAVVAFGAPERAARLLALLIPLAELATAALLLPARTAVAGAIAALALLGVFSIAIAVNLARGRAPECHCFGQLHSAPAGPKTLARNGVLAAAGTLVVAGGGGPSAVAWVTDLHDSTLVAFVAGLVIAGVFVAGTVAFMTLLRSYGRVLVRLDRLEQALSAAGIEADAEADLDVIAPQHGLQPGTPAPAFAVSDVAGASVSLADLLAPRVPVMLLFASPNCGPCTALMPEVAAWQREHSERLTVAVVSDGALEDVQSKAEQFALRHVLHDDANDLYEAYRANGTPGAVLIDGNGIVSSYVGSGRDAIEDLLHEVLDAPGLPVGAPAPAVELTSLDGEPTTLASDPESAHDTLVLFWNPDCGYCRAMHQDVLTWETRVNGSGPRLIVVSSGDPERTREDAFSSTVLLDNEFRAGDVLGATGTPSAVLLGADGRVASSVAVGAQAVLALANRPARPARAGSSR